MSKTTVNLIHSENALAHHLLLQQEHIERSAISYVSIASLFATGSPRLDGEDEEHVRTLAESGAVLPPIVVHLPSRQVVDGVHRLKAAILRGETEIAARFFHGDETDTFLLAVAANTQHGLPLSQRDRLAAAERIFTYHPEWSDRMVAIVVGLSGKKIAALRREVAQHTAQPDIRIGRDGRARPVDGAARRERAAELIANYPDVSLRQIAREAGIAPATAADVRDRIRRGENPVVIRSGQAKKTAAKDVDIAETLLHEPLTKILSELRQTFDQLRKDPSIRLTDAGRTLLRMFDSCQAVVLAQDTMTERLPPHCLDSVADLSVAYAEILQSFAAKLRHLQQLDAV